MQVREEDFVVAAVRRLHPHAGAVLLLGRPGLQGKGLAAAAGGAAGRGKALINILPLDPGESITTIMPLPEDETTWGQLDVMFATTSGTVRRNKLSDFVEVRRSGIIAMKLDEGEAHRRRADLHRERRRAADHRGRPVHPLPGHRRARVHRPHLDGRARHRARRRRQGDLAVDPAPRRRDRRRARGLSQARQRGAARAERRGGERAADGEEDTCARASNSASSAMSNCRRPSSSCSRCRSAASASAPRPTNTASPAAAAKASSPWTTAKRKDGKFKLKPKIGRLVGSFPVEEDDQIMLVTDAGQADPHAGRRHPHRRPLDARRDRVQYRRRRARGVGGAALRRRRRLRARRRPFATSLRDSEQPQCIAARDHLLLGGGEAAMREGLRSRSGTDFSTAIGQSVPMSTWSAPSMSTAARMVTGLRPMVSI